MQQRCVREKGDKTAKAALLARVAACFLSAHEQVATRLDPNKPRGRFISDQATGKIICR